MYIDLKNKYFSSMATCNLKSEIISRVKHSEGEQNLSPKCVFVIRIILG